MAEGRVVDSNMLSLSSFSGNLFAVLVYFPEAEDFGFGLVVGNAVFVNCTGAMTFVFFTLFSKKKKKNMLDFPM